MSTKIWVAYKLKDPSDLWEFVRSCRLKATAAVVQELRLIYAELYDGVDPTSPRYKDRLARVQTVWSELPPEEQDWRVRHDLVHSVLKRMYRISTTAIEKSYFNFDVSIGFRHFKGEVYIIPYCDTRMRNVLDFLAEDSRIVDFHYQNQTDKPEEIPDAEWEARGLVWDGMIDSDQWKDLLVLDICKYDMYGQLDPYLDIALERTKKQRQQQTKKQKRGKGWESSA